MTADLDPGSRRRSPSDLPSFLVNPSCGLESSGVGRRAARRRAAATAAAAAEGGGSRRTPATAGLRPGAGLRRHPAVVQHADGEPLSIAGARREGHVVLIDFWTYTCINCIRTLPYVKSGTRRYRERRAGRDRRALARVPVREGRRQRRRRDRAGRDPLPGGPGQRPRHLERLRQPVLAGQVPDRLQRRGPLRPLRRG